MSRKGRVISFTASDELFDVIETIAFDSDETMASTARTIVVDYLRQAGVFSVKDPALNSSTRNSFVRRFIAEGGAA
ncbi:hypothetical protein [Methylobacterium oryzae]|uniref:hypothetical protein n=1 Tax=Methylobacterium oryzae TaxID=334852 RepID=UPI001F43EB59|nr:hypothetical protein [Methylobacterium oryzae]UIN36389.1 hypothetical protein LXM90_07800 [Methylobacterium oryzae]